MPKQPKNVVTDPVSEGIGGYFALELPDYGRDESRLRFHSARAALASLLTQAGISRAWLPYFLCDTVCAELHRVGIAVAKYELESDLSPAHDLEIGESEVALIVDYFGVRGCQVRQALDRLPSERCVVDCSQAFFASPSSCLGSIYSPRKFFGVPDGGYLATEQDVDEPELRDEWSISRCDHLLFRLDRAPEDGLEAYRRAENSLKDAPHRKMSRLTQRLLRGIDYTEAAHRRRSNFAAVHQLFANVNRLAFNLSTTDVPLTYPLHLPEMAEQIRSALLQHRIFTPTYWPELLDDDQPNAQARRLAVDIVHIPIDQRYDATLLEARLCDIPEIRRLLSR